MLPGPAPTTRGPARGRVTASAMAVTRERRPISVLGRSWARPARARRSLSHHPDRLTPVRSRRSGRVRAWRVRPGCGLRAAGAGSTSHFRWLPSSVRTRTGAWREADSCRRPDGCRCWTRPRAALRRVRVRHTVGNVTGHEPRKQPQPQPRPVPRLALLLVLGLVIGLLGMHGLGTAAALSSTGATEQHLSRHAAAAQADPRHQCPDDEDQGPVRTPGTRSRCAHLRPCPDPPASPRRRPRPSPACRAPVLTPRLRCRARWLMSPPEGGHRPCSPTSRSCG